MICIYMLQCCYYKAQFRYVQIRSLFLFFGSEAHFGFLLQGLVQPRPSSDCFREAFEPILSIGCIRRGFLWTSNTVFWALRSQWTLVLRCAFRKSPSELYKITVLCLLVLPTLTKWRKYHNLLAHPSSSNRRGIMLLFYYIQLYHRPEVVLGVVDVLFFGC
jgi:hypothetical protein